MLRREGFSPVHADQGDFGRAMGFATRTSERLRMRKKSGKVLVEALTESEALLEPYNGLRASNTPKEHEFRARHLY